MLLFEIRFKSPTDIYDFIFLEYRISVFMAGISEGQKINQDRCRVIITRI